MTDNSETLADQDDGNTETGEKINNFLISICNYLIDTVAVFYFENITFFL